MTKSIQHHRHFDEISNCWSSWWLAWSGCHQQNEYFLACGSTTEGSEGQCSVTTVVATSSTSKSRHVMCGRNMLPNLQFHLHHPFLGFIWDMEDKGLDLQTAACTVGMQPGNCLVPWLYNASYKTIYAIHRSNPLEDRSGFGCSKVATEPVKLLFPP